MSNDDLPSPCPDGSAGERPGRFEKFNAATGAISAAAGTAGLASNLRDQGSLTPDVATSADSLASSLLGVGREVVGCLRDWLGW